MFNWHCTCTICTTHKEYYSLHKTITDIVWLAQHTHYHKTGRIKSSFYILWEDNHVGANLRLNQIVCRCKEAKKKPRGEQNPVYSKRGILVLKYDCSVSILNGTGEIHIRDSWVYFKYSI